MAKSYDIPTEKQQAFYRTQVVTQVVQVIYVIDSIQVIRVIQVYTEKVTVFSGAIWWPNLELMQVAPSGGQIFN